MREAEPRVSEKAERFVAVQRDFHHARDALDRVLWAAFHDLWPGRAGDRISVSISCDGRCRQIEGRAVILRNGTRMGLYVDTKMGRLPVSEPYAKTVRILR